MSSNFITQLVGFLTGLIVAIISGGMIMQMHGLENTNAYLVLWAALIGGLMVMIVGGLGACYAYVCDHPEKWTDKNE